MKKIILIIALLFLISLSYNVFSASEPGNLILHYDFENNVDNQVISGQFKLKKGAGAEYNESVINSTAGTKSLLCANLSSPSAHSFNFTTVPSFQNYNEITITFLTRRFSPTAQPPVKEYGRALAFGDISNSDYTNGYVFFKATATKTEGAYYNNTGFEGNHPDNFPTARVGWRRYTFIINSTGAYFYENATLRQSQSASIQTAWNGSFKMWGNNSLQFCDFGIIGVIPAHVNIDEFKIYNISLIPAEIESLTTFNNIDRITPIINSSWNVTSNNTLNNADLTFSDTTTWNRGGTINISSNLLSFTVTASQVSNMSCALDLDLNYTAMTRINPNYGSASLMDTAHSTTLADNISVGLHCVYCSFISSSGNESFNSTSGCLPVHRYGNISNPKMFVNSTIVWNYTGYFGGPEQAENFTEELNNSLQSCNPINGSCDISINFSSDSDGILNIYDIDIQYTIIDKYKPIIHNINVTPTPAQVQDTLSVKVNATDNVNVSKVNASIEGSSSDLTYNTASGLYEGTLTAPATAGIYTITVIAVDQANLTTTDTTLLTVDSSNAELIVDGDYITFNLTEPDENVTVEINATIFNRGGSDADSFDVELLIDNSSVKSNTISISANSNATTSFEWNTTVGNHSITIKSDSTEIITEDNESNNNATVYLFVLDITPPTINEITTDEVSEGENLTIKVNATDNDAISEVTASINETFLILTYNTTSNLYEYKIANVSTGTHTLIITVTDINGLVTTEKISVTVNSITADLLLNPEDVSFSQQILKDGESVIIYANISNDGGTNAENFTVELLVDGISQQNNSLDVKANSKNQTSFTWTATYGDHNLTFKVDSLNNISESNESNNELNKTISVVDATAPSINDVILPAIIYENSDLTIKINATDNVNVNKVNATINGTELLFNYNATSNLYENKTTAPTAGIYNLTVTVTDADNLTVSKTQLVQIYDSEADLTLDYIDLIFSPIVSNITENNNLTINVTIHNNGGTDANNFNVELSIDGIPQINNTLSVSKASNASTVFNWNATYGMHNLAIKVDIDNDISESNETNNELNKIIFALDITPPPTLSLTADPSNWTSQTTFNISWSAVTDNNGINRYEYQIDYGDFISIGSATSFVTPAQSQGVHTVYVRAVDGVGNLGDLADISIYVDLTAPNTPVIREWHSGKNWTQHKSPYLSWTDPGDEGSGITMYNISLNSTVFTNNGANLTYHNSNLSTGIYTFKVMAYDALNQTSSWSNEVTVYIDTTKPSAPTINSSTHPDNNTWYTINTPVFDLTPSTDDSGIYGYYYIVDKTKNTTPDTMSLWTTNTTINISSLGGVQYGTNETNTSNQTGLADGTWYFHVIAKDNAGNVGTDVAHYKVNIDTTGPSIISYTPTNNSNVTDSSLTITVNYIDLSTGVNTSSVIFKLDSIDVTNDSTINGTTLTYQSSALIFGKHNATIYLEDNLTNSRSLTWFFNVVPGIPVNLSLLYADGLTKVFELKIENNQSYSSNFSWAIDTGDGTELASTQNISLAPNEDGFVYVEYTYSSYGTYTVTGTATDGNATGSDTITVSDIDTRDLALLNNTGTNSIFEFVIDNKAYLTLTNVTWDFVTGDSLTINSTENIILEGNEAIFTYVEHDYSTNGTYGVTATSYNNTISDAETLSITI